MEEVESSILSSSTVSSRAECLFLGGVIAGEGYFSVRTLPPFANGAPRQRFLFGMHMATRDRPLLVALAGALGRGHVRDAPPRRAHWEPMSSLLLTAIPDHLTRTIPFCDAFLMPSAKRRDYIDWREALHRYVASRPSRQPGRCQIDGCSLPVRGRGLCRRHYYRATGY